MNKLQYKTNNPNTEESDHVVYASAANELEDINVQGVNLAIFPRKVTRRLKNFIDGLDLNRFPPLQTSFYYYQCAEILHTHLQKASDDQEGLGLFIEDISAITAYFSSIAGKDFIRFNLYTIDNDMCRNFHADYNNLRLLCTYRGAGTQWLSNEFVKSGYGGRPENAIEQDEIQQLETFWIGILKGESYFNNEGNGIVHRSPPMGEKKVKRLLLKIDA